MVKAQYHVKYDSWLQEKFFYYLHAIHKLIFDKIFTYLMQSGIALIMQINHQDEKKAIHLSQILV